MFAKVMIVCSVVAAAAAGTPGYLNGALAIGAQSEHTVRGFGGFSSISKQAKAIDAPYSSVRKTDIRVTNDGIAHPVAHYAAAPALAHHAYAAPVAHHAYAAPVAHPAYAAPVAHHAYAAPVAHHAYAAPVAHYAHPVAHHAYAAPHVKAAAVPAGLGVAYSPATAVATATFSGYGVQYGY